MRDVWREESPGEQRDRERERERDLVQLLNCDPTLVVFSFKYCLSICSLGKWTLLGETWVMGNSAGKREEGVIGGGQ